MAAILHSSLMASASSFLKMLSVSTVMFDCSRPLFSRSFTAMKSREKEHYITCSLPRVTLRYRLSPEQSFKRTFNDHSSLMVSHMSVVVFSFRRSIPGARKFDVMFLLPCYNLSLQLRLPYTEIKQLHLHDLCTLK